MESFRTAGFESVLSQALTTVRALEYAWKARASIIH